MPLDGLLNKLIEQIPGLAFGIFVYWDQTRFNQKLVNTILRILLAKQKREEEEDR